MRAPQCFQRVGVTIFQIFCHQERYLTDQRRNSLRLMKCKTVRMAAASECLGNALTRIEGECKISEDTEQEAHAALRLVLKQAAFIHTRLQEFSQFAPTADIQKMCQEIASAPIHIEQDTFEVLAVPREPEEE